MMTFRSSRASTATPTGGFRSKFEASVAEALAGTGAEYEAGHIPYSVTLCAKYLPDWILHLQAIVLEAKGYFPPEDRTKMLRIKENHPDLDIRIIFQTPNNKATKAKNPLTYAGWAEKNGFPWCKGPGIPEAWLKHRPTASSRAAFDAVVACKRSSSNDGGSTNASAPA